MVCLVHLQVNDHRVNYVHVEKTEYVKRFDFQNRNTGYYSSVQPLLSSESADIHCNLLGNIHQSCVLNTMKHREDLQKDNYARAGTHTKSAIQLTDACIS